MKWPGVFLGLLLCCLVIPHAGAGEERKREFAKAVRSLFALQDTLAYGDMGGLLGQREVLSALNENLPPELSEAEANSDTVFVLAAYVLSGGQPAYAETYAKRTGLSDRSRKLLQGAAAYMRGHLDEAGSSLASVDPLSFPPIYGGRLALTKAMLSDSHSTERNKFLSVAIALMPGTLVEEAALRRSALSSVEAGDPRLFGRRAERYIRRFPRSIYATEFLSEMAAHVIKFHRSGHAVDLDKLDLVYATQPVNRRRQLYLQLARDATTADVPELARFAGSRVLRLSVDGSVEQALGTLYAWIFAVTDQDHDAANDRLSAIDRTRLDASDRAILDAALEMIAQIRSPARSPESAANDMPEMPEALRLLEERASVAMSSSDKLLESQ